MLSLSNLKRRTRTFCVGLALLGPALSVSAYDLYWTERKQVVASDLDGTPTVLFNGETSTPAMASFAVDIAVTDTHIYWSGHNGGDIWRANRDGTEATQLIPNAGSNVHFLAINEDKGRIYYSDFTTGLFWAALDGSSVNQIIWPADPAVPYTGIALAASEESADELFVLQTANNDLIRFFPDGWTAQVEAELPDGKDTYGLAFDPDTQMVYYTNYTTGTLNSYNLNTDEHEQFWTPGMSKPLGLKLSPSGTHLLIAERDRGISAYELATGGYELLIERSTVHFGVGVTTDPGTLDVPPPPPPPPPPVEDGDVLWVADFEDDNAGSVPVADWADVTGWGNDGDVMVLEDTENEFGFGTDNQFLRVDQIVGTFNLTSPSLPSNAEVITYSFDFIGRFKEGDGRWLQALIRGNAGFAHITSIVMSNTTLRGAGTPAPSWGENDVPIRFETIVNNSPVAVVYQGPDGESHEVASATATVWTYDYNTKFWQKIKESYAYNRNANLTTGTPLVNVGFLVDTNTATRTFDLDNVQVRLGAHLSDFSETGADFSTWQTTVFDETQQNDPEISGADADPDGDGIPNLLEYALGGHPLEASRERLPAATVQEVSVEGTAADYLTLSVTVQDSASDVAINVHASSDLENWSEEAVLISSQSNEDGTTTHTYRDIEPVGDSSRRFLHIDASLN